MTEQNQNHDLMKGIELLFFAYRDFISEADDVLKDYGFGRAHHRVLHFVRRNPGITVAELLSILQITKQSLGRVLRALVEDGFIEQVTLKKDRRQRHLHLTALGIDLHNQLLERQQQLMQRAYNACPPQDREGFWHVLQELITKEGRDDVLRLVEKTPPALSNN
ncbi:MAG: MarR family transcriptional regulator [Kordiimonas sp.]|nr:MarR family transcriptional regulator [Kordiimonas sp.]